MSPQQPSLLDDASLEQRILDRAEASRQTEAGVRKSEKKIAYDPGAAWKLGAIQALEIVAKNGVAFSADDVWQQLGEVDARFASAMGAVFRIAAKSNLIERAGWGESARPSRHRSGLRLWRLKAAPAR